MVKYSFFTMAGLAAALPLNINLGAYSPALVVGDGEISFGGNQDVSNLMNVLEGAAVNAAAGATGAAAGAAPAVQPAASGEPVVAAAAADPALDQQAQQIAALQGMGKEIAPRVTVAETPSVGKRDLTGFDRALKFAEVALKDGPKVQLGTGAEGSGVGIIVDNNPTAAARPGTGVGEAGAAAKRSVAEAPAPKAVRAKVTTMYVRSGVPASFQSSSNNVFARDLEAGAAAAVAAASAPVVISRRDAIDAVNLNVDGNQGVTMTFVETVSDDEED